MVSQRKIYDERYAGSSYDTRSAVRVLPAETEALEAAAARAIATSDSAAAVSLLDFGYGTGRVTNEFALAFPARFGERARSLTVVAYDVSAVGLRKAAATLTAEHGFTPRRALRWHDDKDSGYIAGTLARSSRGVDVSVVFVHGHEREPVASVAGLLRDANARTPYLLTTSWYSGLGHVPGHDRRREYVRMLAAATADRGELLLAVATTGDLVDAQRTWAERLARGEVGRHPVRTAGDVMYRTELHQLNYWHLFATDLDDLLQDVCGPHHHARIEAIRLPDPEFTSTAEAQANHDRVRAFNDTVAGRAWTAADYAAVHTAVAIRSYRP
ncbi:hypothetical protein [Dactylosporangium matsuzakiense]|uniref:hypothetical protein n=1 Tax=Dactylosporangium matsuzakiense TaxID=53360 RepID=UPI0021C39482|nr:hypothetical protein [Dactylosporangium matsuzakiense]UWZ47361.1 hypothetical protein Dmats_13720 [Dactylosporangium matsuzakiense]